MSLDDIDPVMAIEVAAYPFPWTPGNFRDCLESGYSCWVMECDAVLVGYSILMAGVREGHILNCCVHPDWQGRGLGRRLAERMLESVSGYGIDCFFLEVRPSNEPALRLYERMGFETVGLRRNYYPAAIGREDALVMRLCP
jgi:ribosomal-protein-alanine N-acetyltransferase